MQAGRRDSNFGWAGVILFLIVILVPLAWGAAPATAATFTVTSMNDGTFAHDANPGDGKCVDGWGVCTLRAAMEEAFYLAWSDSSASHVIRFSRPMDIYLDPEVTDLPPLVCTTLDASEHWQGPRSPGVSIHGTLQKDYGITMIEYSRVYGLLITGFNKAGIYIPGSVNTAGSTGKGQGNVIDNCKVGVLISATTLDDEDAAAEGTISAPDNNLVQSNCIGLAADVNAALPCMEGITLISGADGNVIGGNRTAGDYNAPGNYIAGNTRYGIRVSDMWTDRNIIAGNFIGYNALTSQIIPNGWHGIRVDQKAAHTQIGGGGYAGNFISCSGWSGIGLDLAAYTQIEDNTIFGNDYHGIHVGNSWDTYIYNNHIAQNKQYGVYVQGPAAVRNIISYNSIYGNGSKGIKLADGGNNSIPAPVISSTGGGVFTGTASGGALIVEVYEDSNYQGQTYLGMAVVNQSTGAWTCSVSGASGPTYTATGRDSAGNTSEFSTK